MDEDRFQETTVLAPVCVRCGRVIRAGEPRMNYPPPEGPVHFDCDRTRP